MKYPKIILIIVIISFFAMPDLALCLRPESTANDNQDLEWANLTFFLDLYIPAHVAGKNRTANFVYDRDILIAAASKKLLLREYDLIIGELIRNALDEQREGPITVTLTDAGDTLRLVVSNKISDDIIFRLEALRQKMCEQARCGNMYRIKHSKAFFVWDPDDEQQSPHRIASEDEIQQLPLGEVMFIEGASTKSISSDETSGGKGIGLALIRRAVASLGGRIFVEVNDSNIDFILELPKVVYNHQPHEDALLVPLTVFLGSQQANQAISLSA